MDLDAISSAAETIRAALEKLGSADERQSALIGCGYCQDCGADHRRMYDRRGFWICDTCAEHERTPAADETRGREREGGRG